MFRASPDCDDITPGIGERAPCVTSDASQAAYDTASTSQRHRTSEPVAARLSHGERRAAINRRSPADWTVFRNRICENALRHRAIREIDYVVGSIQHLR